MKVIEPFRYLDQGVFDEEARKIFLAQWLYACLTDDVAQARDHFVMDIMGRSVVIYNNGKELKAFQNVCPHRFNRLLAEGRGNGPLLCRYHSWAYDGNGKLIGQERMNLYPETDTKICLKEYKLAVIGKFIFIHFNEKPLESVEEQLGELTEELLLVSEVLGEKINEQLIPHKTNWKFIVENVVEFHHCKSIHQTTLVRSGFCSLPPEWFRVKNNSYAINPCQEDETIKKRHSIFNKYLSRKVVNTDFKHNLIFPNFTLSIFEGVIITVGQILPVSPGITNYRLNYYCTTLLNPNSVGENILEDIKKSSPAYNDQIFYEDRLMLEQLQQGVAETTSGGLIYKSEDRVIWFCESYFKLMQSEN